MTHLNLRDKFPAQQVHSISTIKGITEYHQQPNDTVYHHTTLPFILVHIRTLI